MSPAQVLLLVKEEKEMGLGFGLLPILEEISTGDTSPVDRDELDKEFTAFMRSVRLPCNVKDWEREWDSPKPPVEKLVAVELLWPEYQGDTAGDTENVRGMLVVPKKSVGHKYDGKHGGYEREALGAYDLPAEIQGNLVSCLNSSLASRTWKCYQTAYKVFIEALLEFDIIAPDIITLRHLLIFVGVSLDKGRAAGTIRSYLSGIRKVAEAKGGSFSGEDLKLVYSIIKGKAHTEALRPQRILMTVQMMVHLKQKLKETNKTEWPSHDKRALWMLATWLFWTSCRGGELALEVEESFSPQNDLLWEDVKVEEGGETIKITLKAPKETRGLARVTVELYRTGDDLCPVTAWENFRKANKVGERPDMPIFRWQSGRNITVKKLNQWLKVFLGDCVDYEQGRLGVHCFRNAIPSLMRALGYGEEEIMAQGRWTSEAYLRYVKMDRLKKVGERRRLVGDINKEVRKFTRM